MKTDGIVGEFWNGPKDGCGQLWKICKSMKKEEEKRMGGYISNSVVQPFYMILTNYVYMVSSRK